MFIVFNIEESRLFGDGTIVRQGRHMYGAGGEAPELRYQRNGREWYVNFQNGYRMYWTPPSWGLPLWMTKEGRALRRKWRATVKAAKQRITEEEIAYAANG